METDHRLQASLLLKKLRRREARLGRELEYHLKQIILDYERQLRELREAADDMAVELMNQKAPSGD